TLERLCNELSKIAFCDIGKVVRWGKTGAEVTPSAELDEDTRLAIKRIWTGKDGQVRVEMHDKRQALTDLAQHFGLRLGGGGVNIGIGLNGAPALAKPDLRGLSNERLAELGSMFLALEAEASAAELPPSSSKNPRKTKGIAKMAD